MANATYNRLSDYALFELYEAVCEQAVQGNEGEYLASFREKIMPLQIEIERRGLDPSR